MSETTAIAMIGPSEIIALNKDNPQVAALMYNIEIGGGIIEKDVRRVKNPSGGSLMFEIARASGDPDCVRELVGVPIAIVPRRQLWADKGIGSGDAPACTSNNLIDGVKRRDEKGAVNIPDKILDIAIPGGTEGKCAECYFNQWDSALGKDGVSPAKGKRCQETRVIYFLRIGDVLPVRLTVPSGSLGKFLAAIKQIPVRLDQAVVKLWLTKEKSQDGVEFAAYNVALEKALDADAVAALGVYRGLFQKLIDNAVADRTDEADAARRQQRAASRGPKDEPIPDDKKFK